MTVRERSGTMAYLAPLTTYSGKAASAWVKQHPELKLVNCGSNHDVLKAVWSGQTEFALVAIENVLGDAVEATLSFFAEHVLQNGVEHDSGARPVIIGEIMQVIDHVLVGKQGACLHNLWGVQRVYSHQQGLLQCQRYLSKRGWAQHETNSTAEACVAVLKDPHGMSVAICSNEAAFSHINDGLVILDNQIMDSNENMTRFIVLGPNMPEPTGNDRTTLVVLTEDKSSALVDVLRPFGEAGISFSKITSRTLKTVLGECWFFLEAKAHQAEPAFQIALAQVNGCAKRIEIMGSYPRCI